MGQVLHGATQRSRLSSHIAGLFAAGQVVSTGKQAEQALGLGRGISRLSGLADRDSEFKLPAGRGDEFARGGGRDPRDKPRPVMQSRDMLCETFLSIG